MADCGSTEAALKATRDGEDNALSGEALENALAINTNYCAPARKAGVRWGISIGLVFLLWSALHFFLLGRTMQRDLWTPDEEPATA